MDKKKGMIIAGFIAVAAVLFLFSYGPITGLISSQLARTNVYYDDSGFPEKEISFYTNGIVEIQYSWFGSKLESLLILTKDQQGNIESEFFIERTTDEWNAYLDKIEAKAKDRRLSKTSRAVRSFLISTKLKRVVD